MNRDEAKQLLPIIQAFAEGKTVQCRQGISDAWEDVIGNVNFLLHAHNYRIKPEPKLRPWKCDEGPSYLIVKSKLDANRYWPFRLCRKVANGKYRTGPKPETDFISNEELADLFVWVHEDGTEHPCGVLEAQP